MSVSALQTKRDAAIAAMESGDYASAIQYALSAKMLLATMPNANRSADGGSQGLSWNAQAIDSFIGECKQLQTASAVSSSGIRCTKVRYVRPSD